MQNTLEECDTTEEDAVLFVVEEDGSISQRVSLTCPTHLGQCANKTRLPIC